jgi:hypothetical protein
MRVHSGVRVIHYAYSEPFKGFARKGTARYRAAKPDSVAPQNDPPFNAFALSQAILRLSGENCEMTPQFWRAIVQDLQNYEAFRAFCQAEIDRVDREAAARPSEDGRDGAQHQSDPTGPCLSSPSEGPKFRFDVR